ncbi:uncharacterized protein A1O5_05001 [Cladophialophora psammophila CBS 110553]|uniref:Choline monooxygenase, chloroplastic n=1 Tax=Cladophialophora psammophila CBS 110553 TaxID=1182543 RepID=W9X6F4_9EURO|nr:uncharacterized protein A1O5_05001 [Cladophialophora psammophila CBS 110553]EXJ72496.1 hypothetical protein A1O5_05001 [Cladophialophora psammophila CBS 110553]
MLEASNSSFSTTLPASWFREKAIYDLERRAIFSKRWIIVSHKARFEKPGQYVRYDMAGYPFFIVNDRKGNIKAFLNVCRHRAFPIVHEQQGTASIFSCKYHGWSYGLGGNLAKAPRFEAYPEFDKTQFSLYAVHLHIDDMGFIWVNLDGEERPQISWEEQFLEVDHQTRLECIKMDDYVFAESWSLDACHFNWKTLVENYNECYHCQVAHPGIAPAITKDSKFDVETVRSYVRHLGEDNSVDDIVASPTYMFPNASHTITRHFFYIMSIVPLSSTTSSMRYEIYRNKNSSLETFTKEVEFFKQVEREDKWLGNETQRNLNTDTYVSGPLHPYMEQAVAYFEGLTRQALREHMDKEKEAGREIWPVRRPYKGEQLALDEDFCKEVCSSSTLANGGKEWF